MDNLCADVHESLSLWSSFFQQLKVLESLLFHTERCHRFLHCCLLPSPLKAEAPKFRHWGASHYEARWHEVQNFLGQLRPVLSVLSLAELAP